MGQFIKTNGDYNIKTADGGVIKLDTGPGIGRVVITGNVLIGGDTTTVNAENLNIQDNIIILNDGETGPGVTLRYSGIQIERGTLISSSFIFDENDDSWNIVNGSPEEGINWTNTKLRVASIRTNTDTDLGDLTLIGTGTGVVKITGHTDYTAEILSRKAIDDINATDFADDILVNKGYVDFAITNQPSFQITSDDSRVILTDAVGPSAAANLAYAAGLGFTTYGESAVSIILDAQMSAQFFKSHLTVPRLELGVIGQAGPYIITTGDGVTNENINIVTQGTGKLYTNYGLQLEEIPVSPAPVLGSTILHAGQINTGSSGLFFVNDSTDTAKQTGELVSKNRALLFSMIF